MSRFFLAVVAVLTLGACGAGRESVPAGSTESSRAGALPALARVVCRPPGPPRVETATVRPQRDGVHVRFVNETGKDLAAAMLDEDGRGGGANAPQGTSTRVVDLRPGTASIACFDPFTEDAGKVAKTALEIVDEDGVWISTRLTCKRWFSGTLDYVPNARGNADPLEAARERLRGYLQAGDVVEPAGYPEAKQRPSYRLVRAGDVPAVVELQEDRAGGWLGGSVTGCSSFQK
jgi:hypothetical protein